MGFKLRLSLFLGLIAVPAGILTFLSLRAVLDEQRSALADLRLRIPAVQSALQDRLQSILEQAPRVVAAGDPAASGDIPEIEFVFTLDERGQFANPRVLQPRLPERSAAFEVALGRGEQREFRVRDVPGAVVAYGEALERATTNAETVEALNALARCSNVLGDSANVLALHRRLQQYAHTLDPDGAHPLTHSYLRRALRWLPARNREAAFPDSAAWERGISIVQEWASAVLTGRIPLHPGTRLAVRELRFTLRHYSWKRAADELQADLDRIERRADFVAAYDGLLETAVLRPSVTYLSGLREGGRSWFAALQPAGDGGTIGSLIDLDVLAESVLDTPGGMQIRAAGFDIVFFDADFTSEFERRYVDAVRVVSPVSSAIYRLNVGLYSRDQPFVFEHYRNRNALIIAGIAFLAGAIGLGAYVAGA